MNKIPEDPLPMLYDLCNWAYFNWIERSAERDIWWERYNHFLKEIEKYEK